MKITLLRGEVTEIDDIDLLRVQGYNWYANKAVNGVTYVCAKVKIDGLWTTVWMHRLLMDAPKGMLVDHRDGNGLNNQRQSNLRLATRFQNNLNRAINNFSGYRGVHFLKRRGNQLRKPWIARATYDSRSHHIGYFATPEEAALAYNRVALKLQGDFATLNIIRDPGNSVIAVL